MREQTTSFVWVVIGGLLMIGLGVLLWLSQPLDEPSGMERVLAVASVFFGLFILFKQRWALIGGSLTLLVGIGVFFIHTWYDSIWADDPGLIWPNLFKMVIGVILLILIGRERVDQRFFMR